MIPSVTFTSSTSWRLTFLGAGALMACVLVFLLLHLPDVGWAGWMLIVILSPLVVFALVLQVRPETLTLTAAGFTTAGGSRPRPKTVPWADMDGPFFVWTDPKGRQYVAYRFKPDRRPKVPWSAYNQRMGADSFLPMTIGGSAAERVATYNDVRAKALAEALSNVAASGAAESAKPSPIGAS